MSIQILVSSPRTGRLMFVDRTLLVVYSPEVCCTALIDENGKSAPSGLFVPIRYVS